MTDPLTPQDISAHTDWLRRLAAGLVGDHEAEDLAQETWLTALRRPPRSRGSLRAWLATVLRNNARNRARRKAVERRAEPRVAREETADDGDRLSTLRWLLEAVERLEEPYRSTVLGCYFEGRRPHDLANHAGIPASTVRTRLNRALDSLRAQLDERHGGRAAWMALLLPFAAPTPPATTALVSGGAAASSMLTSKVAISAAAAIIVVATALFVVGGDDADTLDDEVFDRTQISSGNLGAVTGPPRRHGDEGTRPGRQAVMPEQGAGANRGDARTVAQPDPTWKLRLRLEAPAALPDESVRFGVQALIVDRDAPTHGYHAAPGADGTVELDLTRQFLNVHGEVSELRVTVDLADFLPAEKSIRVPAAVRRSGMKLDATLALRKADVVTGLITDAEGHPVGKARVGSWRFTDGAFDPKFVDRTSTDATGRFRLRAAPGADALLVACHGESAPAWHRLDASRSPRAVWNGVVEAPSPSAWGRVAIDGVAPETISVSAVREDGEPFVLSGTWLLWVDDAVHRRDASARCADDGSYEIRGLTPGPYRIEPKARPSLSLLRLARTQKLPARADFTPGCVRLRVEVKHDGDPVAYAHARVSNDAVETTSTLVEGDGEFLLAADTRYVLKAWQRDIGETERVIMTGSGGTRTEVCVLRQKPKPTLRIHLEVPEGERFERFGLGFYKAGESAPFRTTDCTTSRNPTEWRFLDPGSYRLEVRPGGWRSGTAHHVAATAEVVMNDAGEYDVRMTCRLGARLRLEVKDTADRWVEAPCLIFDAAGGRVPIRFFKHSDSRWVDWDHELLDGPSTVHPAIPAGRYRVEIRPKGKAPIVKHVDLTPGETADLHVIVE